jgi:hypothetical protein
MISTWKNQKLAFCIALSFVSPVIWAGGIEVLEEPSFFSRFNPREAVIPIQVGMFWTSPGTSQQINIQDLIGNHYTVDTGTDRNVLVGLGYYINGLQKEGMDILFGVNAFYLAHNDVKGTIYQEDLFPNFGYRYRVTNYPIYLAMKAIIFNNENSWYNLTFDAGVGPNIIHTSDYREFILDPNTIPDDTFSGKNTTAFSATAGIGIQFPHVIGNIPFECGYRFFYLGKGKFNSENSQIINNLTTGTQYANAVICSVSI